MTDEVLFERRGALGVITMNRPKALNALTLEMIRAMHPQLDAWATDPAVAAVVIEGEGEKAFCAGGDVRAIYDAGRAGDPLTAVFFAEEYRLNRAIKVFPKPYVALIDGIAMGGGVGVSVHGSHRVATERSLFAMPETGIGLFPDVGGSYFLPRLPGEIGMFLALTGQRLKAADMVYAGVATHYVPSERLAAVKAGLAEGRDAGEVLGEAAADPGPAPLAEHRETIDRCFAGGTVEEIAAALAADGSEWAAKQAGILASKSPTSLKLTFRQIREGAEIDFDANMVMEYRLSQACMAGHDFYEGIRALIVDKDNAPAWRPATLAEVDTAMLDRAFAPLGEGDLLFD